MFLEFLKCILCCEDEDYIGRDDGTSFTDLLLESGSRVYYSLSRRRYVPIHNETIGQSDSITTSQNYEQDCRSSRLIIPIERNYEVFQDSKSFTSPPFTSEALQSVPKPYPPFSQSPFSSVSPSASSSRSSPFPAKPPTPSSISIPSLPSVVTPTSSNVSTHPTLFPDPSPPSSPKRTSSSTKPSPSSVGKPPSSPQPPPPLKRTLFSASSNQIDEKKKMEYTWFEKDPLPIYMIPKDIEDVIEKDKVPEVLNRPLSPSTYKDYFAALLYAEEYYIEKWKKFKLVDVTLELHEAAVYKTLGKKTYLNETNGKSDKIFAKFNVDTIHGKRPFLLSRDFVFAQPSGSGGKVQRFQGLVYRVVKSNIVLVEFEEDFYSQHYPNRKYNITFSFNRVCLKRAHQAIEAASGPSFQDFLFPDYASRKNILTSAPLVYGNYNHDSDENTAVRQILNFQGSPPYLLEGPLSVDYRRPSKTGIAVQQAVPSKTGIVVQQAVLQIYRSSDKNRILICAPTNRTCDVLLGGLKEEIPESDMFRANAAFREVDGVPVDILPLCVYKGECFSCPSLEELIQFRVIFSTFVSSFRLNNEGLTAGHFSHVFLVDASSAIEPEIMIALSNFGNENTSVIVTGAPHNRPPWVRSDIARNNGLSMSYFERLRENKTYKSLKPMFITRL